MNDKLESVFVTLRNTCNGHYTLPVICISRLTHRAGVVAQMQVQSYFINEYEYATQSVIATSEMTPETFFAMLELSGSFLSSYACCCRPTMLAEAR